MFYSAFLPLFSRGKEFEETNEDISHLSDRMARENSSNLLENETRAKVELEK
jgi:hypothetical protein